MAIQIAWRHDTAANWTSVNPILKEGEVGTEWNTGQFKIGDGVTAWNGLGYQGSVGPTQTIPYKSMGDGSDGNVTVSSGVTTLTRDMYYNNLTINGSGVISTAGWKIFVKGVLNIAAAPVGAIQWNGNNGNNASGATGGAVPTAQPGGSVGAINQGGVGSTATTGNGTAGSGGTIGTASDGGPSGTGGGGGTGTSGTGGAGGAARSPSANIPFLKYESNFLFGTILISGGAGGSGGGAGAGDGTNVGGGGGSGGNGGGMVVLYANAIVKSSATPAGVIQANGGNGGTGGNSALAGITGGGGGGSGGGGGFIYIVYNFISGPRVAKAIQANGGTGGAGGNGFGVGATGGAGGNGFGVGATGGAGGNSGGGGRIDIMNKTSNMAMDEVGLNNIVTNPELVGTTPATNVPPTLPGGNGGFGGYDSLDL